MTKQDIVNAYMRGEMDRRGFVRRLTAAGVSATAAMAYAGALVPGVSAGSARTGAGYITRLQDADTTYGSPVPVADMPAALTATIAAVEAAASFASSILSAFTADDFAAAGLDEQAQQVLTDIVDQLQQHAEALQGILDNLGGATAQGGAAGSETPAASGGDLISQLTSLSDQLDQVVASYVAMAPSIDNTEDRLLMNEIIAVAGRQAASVAFMAGKNPVPAPFETPVNPVG